MAQRLFQAWGAALAAIVRDKGVLLLLIGAPVLYGFFYPWFYADEVLTRVPVAVVDGLRKDIVALTARQLTADIDAAVAPALADGRLLPAQEAWARDLGKTNLAALTAYIASAQPIAALSATQTKGKPPAAVVAGALTPDQLAVCSAMGMTPEQFAAGAPGAAAVAKAA